MEQCCPREYKSQSWNRPVYRQRCAETRQSNLMLYLEFLDKKRPDVSRRQIPGEIMSTTKIEWADATWNPVIGCTKVSPGCDHCYAARMATRHAGNPKTPDYHGIAEGGDWTGEVRCLPKRLAEPLHWRKPRQIFVCSMGDLFHEKVPDEFIAAVFGVMTVASQHTFLVLTKRPRRMRAWFEWISVDRRTLPFSCVDYAQEKNYDEIAQQRIESYWEGDPEGPTDWPLPNVFLGVTAENQPWWNVRVHVLRQIPAVTRFVSVEPMLSPINADLDGIDWVIAGGESGPGARPCHPDWIRSLRDQCVAAGTKYFFKSWGDWGPELDLRADFKAIKSQKQTGYGDATYMYRVGKKAAGRELDGETWDQYPVVE